MPVWMVAVLLLLSSPGALAQETASTEAAGSREPYPREANGEASDALAHSPLVPCGQTDVPVMDARRALRLATWNIRAARSAPLDAIKADLEAMQPDVVALQEVDVHVRRSGFVDQPATLAASLGYHYAFAASVKWDGGDYGLAVLSRYPLVDVRRRRMDHGARELRIVLDVTVCANGKPLRLFNHHADVREVPRRAGLSELAELLRPEVGRGIVALGDFNDNPEAPGVQALLGAGLVDLGAAQPSNTAPGGRIDYLLVDPPLARLTSATRVWATGNSDHHAVLVDVEW